MSAQERSEARVASMRDALAAFIDQQRLLPASGGRLVVAVSGGADSLCLLHLLRSLCGPGKRYPTLQLHVAHLNHRLREPVSSQDAAAVAELARAWGLPVTLGEEDIQVLAKRDHLSLEEAAREARYRFLRRVAAGDPIAVAHHQDDQVETLVLHWIRGGGIASMSGLQPRQQDIIRPLLIFTRADTLAYCAQHGLTPLEDASNADLRYQRNRVRHELLPLLEQLNPNICATLLRNSEVMQVDVAWIEVQVDQHWSAVISHEETETIALRRSALLALPLSLQRHLWRRASANLCAGQSPFELRHYTLIEQALSQETGEALTLHLPGQLHFWRQGEQVLLKRVTEQQSLQIVQNNTEVILPVPGEVAVPGTPWLVRAEFVAAEEEAEILESLRTKDVIRTWHKLASNRYSVYIDRIHLDSVLRVRTRRAGDRIRPLGMAHSKKVQDICVDRHIPRQERDHIPLIFSRAQCIWLGGVCIDDRVRLTGETHHLLHLTMQRRYDV